jgi:hypothetical protein
VRRRSPDGTRGGNHAYDDWSSVEPGGCLARDAAAVPNAATQAHFAELAEHFSEDEIVDIVAVISLFGFLNRWNDTMATELEELPLGIGRSVGIDPGKHAPARA